MINFFYILYFINLGLLGPIWYMCLKTENCYLKTCVKIRVCEKVCGNT